MAATTTLLSLGAVALDSATITTATRATAIVAVVCYSHWLLAMLIVMAKEPTAIAATVTATKQYQCEWKVEDGHVNNKDTLQIALRLYLQTSK